MSVRNRFPVAIFRRLSLGSVVCLLLTVLSVQAGPTPQLPPVMVNVVSAKQMDWQPAVSETGTLTAEHGIVVKAEVDGRITQLFFQSGQRVQQGDPLVQLNPDLLNAQLNQYQAELNLAKVAFLRAQGLFTKRVVSAADYDQAQANYQSAAAKVEQVKAQLNQLLIRAPFAGQLGLQQVSIGDFVHSGDAIVNLQSVDPIYVDFSVPEKIMSHLEAGQRIVVTSPAYPNTQFLGQIMAMESLVDADTRTLKVRAVLPNHEGQLVPGEFVEVKAWIDQPHPVVTIPQVALINTPEGKDAVYIVRQQHALLTKVKVLKQRSRDVLIAAGLTPGDWVVTAGQMKLHDQALVHITSKP